MFGDHIGCRRPWWEEEHQAICHRQVGRQEGTLMITSRHTEEMERRTSSTKLMGSRREELSGYGMFYLAVEAFEPVSFLIDVVILFQDNILMPTGCHLSVDIGI